MEEKKAHKIKNYIFLFALLSGIILPLVTNFAGAYFIGLYDITTEGAVNTSSSVFKVLLDVLAFLSLYMYSFVLLFSVILFNAKESKKIILIGFLRILIVYLSAFFVQFALSENFIKYAFAYFKDAVLISVVVDFIIILSLIVIGMLFAKAREKDCNITRMFDFKNTFVKALLVMLALFFVISLCINISGTVNAISALDEAEASSLGQQKWH